MHEKIDECVQFSDFVQWRNDLKRKTSEMIDQNKRISCIERRCKEIEDTLQLKLDKSEMKEIINLVHQLPDIEEVDKIKKFVSSNIKEFRDEHARFRVDFQNHCEIIRRYDDVISLKASSVSVQDQRNQIDEIIEKRHDEAINYIDKLRAEII